MVVRRLGEKSPPEAARVSGQEATMSFSGPTDPPFTLPEPYPFKEQVIIDVMFPGQCGNTPSSSRASLTSSILNSGE